MNSIKWLSTIGLVGCLGLLANPVFSDNYGEPFNYYEPAPDKILKNVEKYHLYQGIEKIRQGNTDYAWSEFGFMLRYFPNHPKALEQIAYLGVQTNQSDKALRYFEKALRLFPNEAETHALHGIFLHQMQRYPEAIVAYQKAIRINPTILEFHYNIALSFLELKQYPEAVKHAQMAYQKGYPLLGLKNKLLAAHQWPETSATHAAQ